MKKVVSLLAVLFLFAGLSFAAEREIGHSTYTAKVQFAGEALFNFQLKNISGSGTPSEISWDSSAIALGEQDETQWVSAKEYAVISATATKAGFSVYMYQTNKQSSNYKAVTPRKNYKGTTVTSQVYSGLVEKSKGEKYVPIAYSMVSSPNDPGFDGEVKVSTAGGNYRADRYLTDEADLDAAGTGSSFDKQYTNIAGSYGLNKAYVGGPVFGAYDKDGNIAPWGNGKDGKGVAYIFFYGGFNNIVGGEEYGTDQLHVIQITE